MVRRIQNIEISIRKHRRKLKRSLLLCGILPLQKELLKGIIDYEKADLSSFISEEHLQVAEEIDHQVDSQAQTPGFFVDRGSRKDFKEFNYRNSTSMQTFKGDFTTSARSIESSNHLIELEKQRDDSIFK